MENDDEKFFYEDEVAMVSPKSGLVKYGLVLTTDKSRSEIELQNTCNNPNEVKVIWHPKGGEEIIPDDKVMLMDRSLMPGDIVRKVGEGKPSQFGYCENINIYATVKIMNTNKIIENISSQYFTHTKPFAIDSSVFFESWVGGVYDVKCKVTFASQDGSIFTLEDPYRQDFICLSTSDSFSLDDNVFYPGQKLKMCLDSLENAKIIRISNLMSCLWHNYKKKYKYGSKWVKVYVQDVVVSSVEIEWYCQTSSKTKPRGEHWPERIITGDNLKKLKTIDLFESCSIQVGDTHWYQIKDTDDLITMKQWRTKCTEDFTTIPDTIPSQIKKGRRQNKLQDAQNLSNENVSSTHTQRIKTSLNKDKCILLPKKSETRSSTSSISSSIHSLKSNRLKRNRMWKLLVKKNKQFNVPKVSTKPNSKVVVEICYTKSVIDVMWQDGSRETGVSSTDLYPVQTLDDLEFFPGDFVTENNPPPDVYGVIESVDHGERTARVQWFKVYPENPSLPIPIEKTDFSVYDLRDHPDFHFKSGCLIIHISPVTNPDINTLTAGQVLSAKPDGKILVMWVNGEETECWPQELFVVKLHDDDGFSFDNEDYDDEDDDAPQATNEELSAEWLSLALPEFTRVHDQELNEKFPKLLVQSLKEATVGMKSFLDAVEHTQDIDKVVKLQESLEQIRLGFNVSSFLPTSETRDLEISYKDLMDNIEKIISKKDKGTEGTEEGAEEELSYENLIGESVEKLKKVVSDFMEKVNLVFNDSHEPSKYCQKEDHSENDDLSGRTEELSITLFNNMAQTLFPILPTAEEIHTTELHHFISLEIISEPKCEVIAKPEEAGVFDLVDTLFEDSHRFIDEQHNVIHPTMSKIIAKDIQILQKSLPAGIWVKTFESRMDLFSVMIRGPERTPYAGGLFLFDIKLPSTYPLQPPLCHYYSFCDDRLNPNLYEDGKVCLSLLGTWSGNGVELWSARDSNLLQLLVSIQGLILVSEPYYNEAGFDSQRGQKLAKENSRVYNEMALIKVVQSMTNMLKNDYVDNKTTRYFKNEILEHVKFHGPKLISTIENWIKLSEKDLTEDEKNVPGYSLLPLSKGFCLSVNKALKEYKEILISMNVMFK